MNRLSFATSNAGLLAVSLALLAYIATVWPSVRSCARWQPTLEVLLVRTIGMPDDPDYFAQVTALNVGDYPILVLSMTNWIDFRGDSKPERYHVSMPILTRIDPGGVMVFSPEHSTGSDEVLEYSGVTSPSDWLDATRGFSRRENRCLKLLLDGGTSPAIKHSKVTNAPYSMMARVEYQELGGRRRTLEVPVSAFIGTREDCEAAVPGGQ